MEHGCACVVGLLIQSCSSPTGLSASCFLARHTRACHHHLVLIVYLHSLFPALHRNFTKEFLMCISHVLSHCFEHLLVFVSNQYTTILTNPTQCCIGLLLIEGLRAIRFLQRQHITYVGSCFEVPFLLQIMSRNRNRKDNPFPISTQEITECLTPRRTSSSAAAPCVWRASRGRQSRRATHPS